VVAEQVQRRHYDGAVAVQNAARGDNVDGDTSAGELSMRREGDIQTVNVDARLGARAKGGDGVGVEQDGDARPGNP
jgi:hypothetical protein